MFTDFDAFHKNLLWSMTTETMVIKLLDFSGHYEHVKMPSALCSKLHFTTSFHGSCSPPAAEERVDWTQGFLVLCFELSDLI